MEYPKTAVNIFKKSQYCEMFLLFFSGQSGGQIFIIFHIKTIMLIVRSTASEKCCGSYCTRSVPPRQKIVFRFLSSLGALLANILDYFHRSDGRWQKTILGCKNYVEPRLWRVVFETSFF